MTTMIWTYRGWLCECSAKYEWYICRCTSCGEENMTGGDGNLIKK